jgi:Dolichyl-phosphate-mannose-protein mannosyltransferase/F5/8 type C domain
VERRAVFAVPPVDGRAPADRGFSVDIGVLGTAALLVVAVLNRMAALLLPQLAEPNYEEALVGLMARHILQGEHVAFWWGHPYLGTVGVYVTAALFWLFGSTTTTLRLAPALLSLVGVGFSYATARLLFGRRWALLCLLWWAVPPAFLLRLSVTPYEYTASVTIGSAALYLTYRALAQPRPRPALWYLLGLSWGLALWDHLVTAGYILTSVGAVALAFLHRAERGAPAARLREALEQSAPARCAAGFVLGSLPFWVWNIRHGFETLTEVVWPAAKASDGLLQRVSALALDLGPELLGRAQGFWHVRANTAWIFAVWFVYAPAVAYATCLAGRRWRAASGASGFGTPDAPRLGLAVASFWLACAQVGLTRYHLARYLVPIYSSTPLLLVAYLRGLSQRAASLTAVAIVGILALHGADTVRLWEGNGGPRERPTAEVIRLLHQAGIGHVYAHYRVAWPIMFESGETIVASDFHVGEGFLGGKTSRGPRSGVYMRPYFDAIEQVDLAPRVAVVTHERLKIPAARELEEALRLLGAAYEEHRIRRYTVFHDFRPPVRHVREIPPSVIALHASERADLARLALDRSISTAWTTRPGSDAILELELDRPRRVAGLVLDPGDHVDEYPGGVRIEVLQDGSSWQTVVDVPHHLGGISWLGEHPKLNRRGTLEVRMTPREIQRLRIHGVARDARPWTVAEVVLYEEDPTVRGARPGAQGGPMPLLRAIEELGITAVYADDEANVLLTHRLPPSVHTVTLRDRRPAGHGERIVRFDQTNGFVLRTASPLLEGRLRRSGVPFAVREWPGGVLYFAAPAPGLPPAYWDYEQLLEIDASSSM